jgi:hypothetical protein
MKQYSAAKNDFYEMGKRRLYLSDILKEIERPAENPVNDYVDSFKERLGSVFPIRNLSLIYDGNKKEVKDGNDYNLPTKEEAEEIIRILERTQ